MWIAARAAPAPAARPPRPGVVGARSHHLLLHARRAPSCTACATTGSRLPRAAREPAAAGRSAGAVALRLPVRALAVRPGRRAAAVQPGATCRSDSPRTAIAISGEAMLDITCAACHTGQLEYDDTSIRDRRRTGPALARVDQARRRSFRRCCWRCRRPPPTRSSSIASPAACSACAIPRTKPCSRERSERRRRGVLHRGLSRDARGSIRSRRAGDASTRSTASRNTVLRRRPRSRQLQGRQRAGEPAAPLGHLEVRLGAVERLGRAADGAQRRRGAGREGAPRAGRRRTAGPCRPIGCTTPRCSSASCTASRPRCGSSGRRAGTRRCCHRSIAREAERGPRAVRQPLPALSRAARLSEVEQPTPREAGRVEDDHRPDHGDRHRSADGEQLRRLPLRRQRARPGEPAPRVDRLGRRARSGDRQGDRARVRRARRHAGGSDPVRRLRPRASPIAERARLQGTPAPRHLGDARRTCTTARSHACTICCRPRGGSPDARSRRVPCSSTRCTSVWRGTTRRARSSSTPPFPGNRNTGHQFRDDGGVGVIGPALSDEDRFAIIEYLKVHGQPGVRRAADRSHARAAGVPADAAGPGVPRTRRHGDLRRIGRALLRWTAVVFGAGGAAGRGPLGVRRPATARTRHRRRGDPAGRSGRRSMRLVRAATAVARRRGARTIASTSATRTRSRTAACAPTLEVDPSLDPRYRHGVLRRAGTSLQGVGAVLERHADRRHGSPTRAAWRSS